MDTQTLIIYFVIAFILLHIPVVGKYIAIIHTLIHEIGHALMAILTGGRVQSIKLFANTSGEAWSRNTKLGQIPTTLAGYPFASVMSLVLLYYLDQQEYTIIMTIIAVFVIVSFVFWIRNLYGLVWVMSFMYMLYRTLTASNPVYITHIITLLVCIIYIEAVEKALTILILSIRQPKNAGDASILRRATLIIPAPVWGLLFFLQAVVIAGYGIYQYVL